MALKANQSVTYTDNRKGFVLSTTRDGGAVIQGPDGQARWYSRGQIRRWIKN